MESVGGSSLALPNLLAIPRRIQAGWSPAGDAPLAHPIPSKSPPSIFPWVCQLLSWGSPYVDFFCASLSLGRPVPQALSPPDHHFSRMIRLNRSDLWAVTQSGIRGSDCGLKLPWVQILTLPQASWVKWTQHAVSLHFTVLSVKSGDASMPPAPRPRLVGRLHEA